MAYRGKFKEIVYPNEQREARVARYRLVLLKRDSTVSAVIHLQRETRAKAYQLTRERDFDMVVSRIVGNELRGVRVDRTRLVVEVRDSYTEYPLNFNAADLPTRQRPREPWKASVVDVESRDIVGGSVALFVDIAGARPADPLLVRALRT
jgi:hypothetical protein